MELKTILLMTLALMIIVFVVGCMSETGPTQAMPSKVASKNAVTTTSEKADFSKVTHADVSTMKGHWTAGASDDGVVVYPSLVDLKGQDVLWEGVSIPVDIEIYSTNFDDHYNEVKGSLVYKGSGFISSWKDGNMFTGGGIQVPFSDMNVPSEKSYGWTYVTVHTPDGKTYSAMDKFTALTP